MAIRDEVRILKSNTLEEFRQKSNELSIRNVGDDNLIHTNIADKKESFTATAGQKFFELSGRFEVLPEQTIDKTTGVAEAYRVGAVRVTKQGTALVQGLASANFKVPNYSLKVTLTGSPTIPSEFVENAVLTQSGGFSGTLLSADSTTLRFKSFTGTLNTGQNLGIPHTDAEKRVVAGNISSKADVDIAHGTLIELITGASANDVIIIDSTSLVDAVNELQDDVGIVENLSTGSKVLTLAVNEHETDLFGTGNASFTGLSATGFQDAIEEVRAELGAHTSLGTDHTTTAVGAINELETAIRGSGSDYTLGTDAGNIVAAINELETGIRGATSDYTTTVGAGSITQDIDTLDAELGTITSGAMGTTASTVSAAIAEHETQLGNANINSIASGNNTITGALVQLHTELGSASLDTSATTHAGAINELHGEINSNDTDIATINTKLGTISAAAFGTSASTVSTAIAELHTDVDARLKLTSGSEQTIASDVKLGSGKVLDLSDGTLLLSEGGAGSVSSFGTAFLQLDGNLTSAPMGLRVDRDHITPSGSMTNHDVELQWDETQVASNAKRAWRLKGMADNGSENTADIVTFYNAEDLITSNDENGISVVWDSSAQNFDFDVNDPTLTFTSGTFRSSGNLGQGTITNLGNTSFALTANQLALGDNEKVLLGTGGDLSIFHNGNNSFIREVGTGSLFVESDNTVHLRNLAGSSTMATFTPGGATTLFHSGSAKIATSAAGVSVTGDVIASDYIQGEAIRVGSTGTDPGDGNLAVNNNATVGGNLTVTGNLTINGTQTILNTSTLEVEDTLILTGTAGSEPDTGGFGIETRLFTGTSVPSGAASNVTGTHSLVYNFATDQWEADGSLVLSEATLGTAKVENTDFGSGKDLVFAAGSGLSEAVTGLSGNTFTVTYTNTDKGSSQLFYKTFTTDAGSNVVASANNDTIDFEGGTGLTTTGSADKVSIKLDDTSVTAGSYGSGTAIPTFTVDAQGRLTQAGTVSVDTYSGWNLTVAGQDRGNIAENENVSFVGGTAIDATYSATNNVITFNHADTSDVSDVDNSGTNFIQDMTFDTFGHVQSVTSAGFSLGDGILTIATAGNGLSGGGTFSANQTSGVTRTITLNSDAASSNSTIVQRTANGDIVADLFKTDDANNISSGSITKLFGESGNDGFIRYAQPAAVRQFLNVADGATNTTNPNNATITITAGTNLTGGGNFTTDQSSNETITINAETGGIGAGTYGSTADGTKIDQITVDAYGRITNITTGNTSSVDDTGTPAILSNGSSPSLNSGISAAEIISLIGAATVNDTGTPAILSDGSLNRTAAQIRSDIGAGTSSFSGAYADLTGKPTIPTNNNQLTNGAGFTTFTSNQATDTTSTVQFGLVRSTGDVVAFFSSDKRLKDNLTPLSNSLEKVSKLTGYEFDWNDKQDVYEGHDIGVVAQEVEEVAPELVQTREDGYKAVKYEKIVPLLIEAIKDLKAEIEELKDINKKV